MGVSMLTVVKDVPHCAPGTSASSGSFLNCVWMRAGLGSACKRDRGLRAYVGHPVKTLVPAVEEVVCLRHAHQAVLCGAAGRGKVPEHGERLAIDGCGRGR